MAHAKSQTSMLFRMILFGATLAVVVPVMRAMSSGALPGGPLRIALVAMFLVTGVLVVGVFQRQLAQRDAARRANELLRFFDDMALLRPRSQAARAILAGEPASDLERRSVNAVAQCLAELACAVAEGATEGRSAVLAHPIVGAWLRALAITPITVSFTAAQRSALQTLFLDVGASRDRSAPLDDGSRALLERDAVMFRTETAERIF